MLIDEFMQCEEVAVLKISDRAIVCQTKQQNLEQRYKREQTRLKEQILEIFLDLFTLYEGRRVLFALKQDIAGELHWEEITGQETDGQQPAASANNIRNDLCILRNTFVLAFTGKCHTKNSFRFQSRPYT